MSSTGRASSARSDFFSRIRRVRLRHLLPDLFLCVICPYLGLLLRADTSAMSPAVHALSQGLPLFVVVAISTFAMCGIYDIVWRYISLRDALQIIRAVSIVSVMTICAGFFLHLGQVPHGSYLVTPFLLTLGMLGIRFLRRLVHEYPSLQKIHRDGKRTIIYGAGTNGRTLVNRLTTDADLGYNVIGFVDDDPEKKGRTVAGFKVIGNLHELGDIIKSERISEILIAAAQPSSDLLLRVLQICSAFGIKPRLIKQLRGGDKVKILRDIDLNDLLQRRRRKIDLSTLQSLIKGKSVMVTGAGGSIGSEIAKQIHGLGPEKLIVVEHSEFALYDIDQKLRDQGGATQVVPILADIQDRRLLDSAFSLHRPQIVFHAAAYKHVHLVEANPYAAILNNVLGTRNLLELSEEYDVESFILISSDKAVNPVGVMGATKRVCELLVTEAGQRLGRRYSSVRFGNVLGSSGSLIPLLKQQITDGQAVTITHRDMKRYFMLIPEAVSLVLRAATLSRAGDIMVLSMGEPVRIVDLVKSLIALMGKKEEEIPVLFTGMRPGEKLAEELYLTGAENSTADPDVLVIPRGDFRSGETGFQRDEFNDEINNLLWEAHNCSPNCVKRIYRFIHGERTAALQETPSILREKYLRPLEARKPRKEEAPASPSELN